jgi:putative transposase
MKDHQHVFAVGKMCRVFKVSRSGYYHWLNRKPSQREVENSELKTNIVEVHRLSRFRLGSPKIQKELEDRGFYISRPRVARLMKQLEIRSIIHRKFKVVTTDSNHGYTLSPNLLNRDFTASSPGQKWVSDITYVKTNQGWLYLTIVLELFDRKIIGWSMSRNMESGNTVIAAFKMAIRNRPVNPEELIFHSDRGVQYACGEFRNLLHSYRILQSMSRKGNCWDNAVAECFFKILKSELIYQIPNLPYGQARIEIFEFIEIWYNKKRKHSYLNYLTPEQFEKSNQSKAA